eukprot:2838406-Rhodomonas_salina.1
MVLPDGLQILYVEQEVGSPTPLCSCYAMSGTEIASAFLCFHHVKGLTEPAATYGTEPVPMHLLRDVRYCAT